MSESVIINGQSFRPYISEHQIQESVKKVANKLNERYAEQQTEDSPQVLFLVTLSGALYFGVDLLREVSFDPQIAFVKCSSYGSSMTSSCDVTMQLKPTLEIKGRDIVIIEDIIETGKTYQKLHEYLIANGAKSVSIATMLFKSSVYSLPLPIDYYGIEIDNDFVVGYGLDYAEQGRNLKHIYILENV